MLRSVFRERWRRERQDRMKVVGYEKCFAAEHVDIHVHPLPSAIYHQPTTVTPCRQSCKALSSTVLHNVPLRITSPTHKALSVFIKQVRMSIGAFVSIHPRSLFELRSRNLLLRRMTVHAILLGTVFLFLLFISSFTTVVCRK